MERFMSVDFLLSGQRPRPVAISPNSHHATIAATMMATMTRMAIFSA
jgi:hypothetical protein